MTSPDPAALRDLPPGARFCVRAFAQGAPLDRIAALLRATRAEAEKHLRVAARQTGCKAVGPGADDGAWRTALSDVLEQAGGQSSRTPSTRCPSSSVLRAVAAEQLDGPLLLAQLDHLADCDPCLASVLDPSGLPTYDPTSITRDKTGCLGAVLLLCVLGASAGAALFS